MLKKLIIVFVYLILFVFLSPLGQGNLSFKIITPAYASLSQHSKPVSKTDSHHASPHPEKDHQDHETNTTHEETAEYLELTPETGIYSPLPWWIILIPLLGALTLFWSRNNYLQGLMVIFTSALTLVVSLLMYPLVIHGRLVGDSIKRGIYYSFPFLPSFQLNLTFKVDPAALILVIATGLIWLLTAIFSHQYLAM